DERSLETATEHLAELTDPLARAITWAALWDMLRDAEIPARLYLPLILNNIRGETDIGVVQDLLAQASSAVWIYGDPTNADSALQILAEHALRALDGAPPGSDLQLSWAHAFIGAARSPEHLSVVRGLLDGIKVFTGLKVDTDLRWALVGALAGVGADDTGRATEPYLTVKDVPSPVRRVRLEATDNMERAMRRRRVDAPAAAGDPIPAKVLSRTGTDYSPRHGIEHPWRQAVFRGGG